MKHICVINLLETGGNKMSELSTITSDLVAVKDFSSLYERFINYIDATPATIETYSKSLKQFFKYLHDEGINRPQRADILAYRDALQAEGKAAGTVQLYIISVRQFFKWTATENIYPNVAENIKTGKVSKGHKKDYLTANQIATILRNVDRTTLAGKRDYAMIALIATAGLRTIEVHRANIADLGASGSSSILWLQGKGRDDKGEYIKLSDTVEQAIRHYLIARPDIQPNDPLFASTSNNNFGNRISTRSIRGIIKDEYRKNGYNSPRLTAHSLRHSAATLNLLNGGTLEETQQLLRHENIGTTMIYLHHIKRENNNSEQRISEAIFN